MKRIIVVSLVAAAMLFSACASNPKPKDPNIGPTDKNAPQTSEIINHQYRGLSNVPDWVLLDQGDIEKMSDFKGFMVYKDTFSGQDLNGVKIMAQDFAIDSQIARNVSVRIQSKFAGAMVGTVDGADSYFEKIVKSLAEARIGGIRKHADYWLLRRYTNPDKTVKDVYEYYILTKVPEEEVQKAVARAFNENPPKSENEIRARDKVKEIMDNDSDW
ncbi:MAG: hypothetical protein JW904_02835 [Spirochaetales bacterium]|nr:hypothetical protein [Spirochaetales bacterium]